MHDQHDANRNDHENDRRGILPPVEAVDEPVDGQKHDDGDADRGWEGKQRCRQRSKAHAHRLQQPSKEHGGHGSERHGVPMGKIRKSKHAVNERDAERAESKLAAVGQRGEDHEVS